MIYYQGATLVITPSLVLLEPQLKFESQGVSNGWCTLQWCELSHVIRGQKSLEVNCKASFLLSSSPFFKKKLGELKLEFKQMQA